MTHSSRAIAWILALSALALALLYGLTTPIFETPDEVLHFGFVRHLAAGQGLPVQPPSVGGHQAGQEASQPPLYYALTAILTGWSDVGKYRMDDWLNPHRQLGNGLAYGNKNTAIHPPDEIWPFQGVPLAVHLTRLPSAFMLAGVVLFSYVAGRQVWPKSPGSALVAAGLVAFLPSALFIAGSVSNDNLIQLLAAAGLWLSLRALRRGADLKDAVILGLVGGLAALTKLSGLAILPLLIVAAAAGSRPRKQSWWVNGSAVAGVAILISGWWYARNLVLYGDPTGLNMMLEQVWRRPPGFSVLNLMEESRFFRITFWGLFGTDNAMADDLFYGVADAMALVAFIGVLVRLASWLRQREWPQNDALIWAFLVAWVGVVFVGYIRWTLLNEANHGRHLFTALAPLAFLFVSGWRSLLPARFGLVPPLVFAALLAVVATAAPWRYTIPAHAGTPVLARGEGVGDGWTQLGYRYAGLIELTAVRTTRKDYRSGDWLEFELVWEMLAKTERNYSLFLHLDRPDGTRITQEDTYPGLGSRPTSHLQPGDTLVERHRLFLPPDRVGPTALQLTIGVYDLASLQRLPVIGLDGKPRPDAPLAATFVLRGPEPSPPLYAVQVDFADGIQLTGVEFAWEGDQLSGALWWRAVAQPTVDYTSFVHLVDASSPAPIAQWDSRPLAGNYPTQFWLPGTVFREPVRLRIPVSFTEDLRLLLGLYDLSSGRRLLTNQGADSVELGLFDVAGGRFVPR